MPALPEPPTRVGAAIPAHTPHAISVMFPTWQDNIYYEEGNPIVTLKMECGYPRFFIHPFIQKVSFFLAEKNKQRISFINCILVMYSSRRQIR